MTEVPDERLAEVRPIRQTRRWGRLSLAQWPISLVLFGQWHGIYSIHTLCNNVKFCPGQQTTKASTPDRVIINDNDSYLIHDLALTFLPGVRSGMFITLFLMMLE